MHARVAAAVAEITSDHRVHQCRMWGLVLKVNDLAPWHAGVAKACVAAFVRSK
jgi:hypothetical protein